MTDKKKVLFVTQEMDPYTALSDVSVIARKLAEHALSQRMEIRILMPKYGSINERRHRLHEVVRLSGMNIIVDDDDFPLIIKVASLPNVRLQVYFLDNDDFFKRKHVFTDDSGNPFDDNAERMIFFCKGVIETVRKFGWPPDIIHCQGWMTSLLPLFIREAYKTEPLFHHSKIVYSVYNNPLENTFDPSITSKASINNLTSDDLQVFLNGDGVSLDKGAAAYSDALVRGSEVLSDEQEHLLMTAGLPVLEHPEEEDFAAIYLDFYHSLLEEEEAVGH